MDAKKNRPEDETEAAQLAPQLYIADSIIRAAQILAGALKERPIVTANIPLVAAVTAGDGITLKCGTQVELNSEKTGEEKETDWHWTGKTAAEVQQDAINLAEANARQAVTDDLNRQINLINCQIGCTKVVGDLTVRIKTPGRITKSVSTITATDYTAEAAAEGFATVKCEGTKCR